MRILAGEVGDGGRLADAACAVAGAASGDAFCRIAGFGKILAALDEPGVRIRQRWEACFDVCVVGCGVLDIVGRERTRDRRHDGIGAHPGDEIPELPREIKCRLAGYARKSAAPIRAAGERMTLGASRGARSGALCSDDCSLGGIGLVAAHGARRVWLVGAMDDVVADRRGLRAVEHRLERSHTALLERSIEHHAVPGLHGDEGRPSKIRGHAAGHGGFAMAHAAELIVQPLALSHRRRARGVGRGIDDQFRVGRQGRQIPLCAELEHQHSAHIALIAGLGGLLSLQQGIGAAPSGQHGDVLFAIDLISDRRRHHRRLREHRP